MSGDAAIQATNVPGADGTVAAVSGQITVAVVLLIVAAFIAILVLYLRRKGYSGSSVAGSSRRSTGRLVFAQHDGSSSHRKALDASILDSLPAAVYRVRPEECGLECAVCICELAEGEEVRFLPKCNHAFHVECIDMWFGSNSTCPLCRLSVAAYGSTNDVISPVRTARRDQERHGSSSSSSSSSSSGRIKDDLVIEIPRSRATTEGGFSSAVSPPPSTRRGSESARTPVVERLRSLGRMMSRGRGKGVCSTTTPRAAGGSDIEQGRIDDVSKQQ